MKFCFATYSSKYYYFYRNYKVEDFCVAIKNGL